MEMLRREKEDRLERAKQKAFGAVSSPPANDDIPGLGRERRLRKTNDKELDKMLLDAANAPVFPSIDLDPAISILAGQQGLMGSEVAESQLIVETEKRGQEGEADLGLFPTIDFGGAATHSWLDLDPSFGASDEMTGLVDSEGQVETDFVEKKRRKSIQKIHQLTGSMIGTEDLAMEKVTWGWLIVRSGARDVRRSWRMWEWVDVGRKQRKASRPGRKRLVSCGGRGTSF
jgi:hypothetical protein